ncbi:hypothetical protein JOE56_001154 [Brevibacterium paucivorans]|uniref:DUF4258 domain-containing protein n=1 Tax=Brevibacterium paucivorans TaxID=170994 RepID=A0ABS2SL32_9MICO|nr:hypothetical protein [Brevibacterium paucivorans]MBM7816460.1 hypothetical protein [Brevibacterium paucivorans]
MRIGIHPRSFKHGLTEEQIVTAIETGMDFARIRRRDANTEPQRWGVIGFDHVGRSVELVVIHVPGGVFVIHANYLTKGFEQEMRNAR